jgi:hypothetical protein
VHWLVIDKIGSGSSDADLVDAGFFPHERRSGRVDVERTGNVFTAQTRGIRQFTLLLSRDALDFTQPIVVTVNGQERFRGVVKEDIDVLEKWADRDEDRTMLYGAEMKISVP